MLVLYGNLVVLGLLILQKHNRRPKATDYSVFRYIQVQEENNVRFLGIQYISLCDPDLGSFLNEDPELTKLILKKSKYLGKMQCSTTTKYFYSILIKMIIVPDDGN